MDGLLNVGGLSGQRQLRVFAHLARGFAARTWEERWRDGTLIGVNERLPYGYFHAEGHGCSVTYSNDLQEGRLERTVRLALRLLLGFDFLHAWRNRDGIREADVVWTHTESQHLAVALLLLRMPRERRPKLIAQCVWLFDRWPRFSALRRLLYTKLLSQVDVLTVHSPENLKRARRMFPHLRSELMLFGIRTDDMRPVRPRAAHLPLRILSLGNDEHRDWATLIDAVNGMGSCCELRIVSRKLKAKQVRRAAHVKVVEPRRNGELLELFEWADLVVVPLKPNLHASGLTVVQEALLHGLPVVSSDTGGLKEAYFADDEVRYVRPQDSAALQDAITDLAGNVDGRFRMAERGQARLRDAGLSSRAYAKRHADLSWELVYGRREIGDLVPPARDYFGDLGLEKARLADGR